MKSELRDFPRRKAIVESAPKSAPRSDRRGRVPLHAGDRVRFRSGIAFEATARGFEVRSDIGTATWRDIPFARETGLAVAAGNRTAGEIALELEQLYSWPAENTLDLLNEVRSAGYLTTSDDEVAHPESSELSEDERRRVILAEVVARAWREPAFRTSFKARPRQTLAEAGLEFRKGLELTVLEDTPTLFHKVIAAPSPGAAETRAALRPPRTPPMNIETRVIRERKGEAIIVLPSSPPRIPPARGAAPRAWA